MQHRIVNRSRMSVRRHSNPVAGFTLLELTVAMLMLGGLTAMVVPLLSRVNAQRRAADARQIALQAAANVLERFAARDWDDVTQKAADAAKLSADSTASLRDARLKVTVHVDPKQPAAKRITVELRWKNREGDVLSPVRLTAFIYRRSGTP